MRLVPHDKSKLKTTYYKMTDNQVILGEFEKSGLDCVLVEGWTSASPYSKANSLNTTIRRSKKAGLYRAIVRKGKVYLIKEDIT